MTDKRCRSLMSLSFLSLVETEPRETTSVSLLLLPLSLYWKAAVAYCSKRADVHKHTNHQLSFLASLPLSLSLSLPPTNPSQGVLKYGYNLFVS